LIATYYPVEMPVIEVLPAVKNGHQENERIRKERRRKTAGKILETPKKGPDLHKKPNDFIYGGEK
jgi:hypothetical protein